MNEIGTVTIPTQEYMELVHRASSQGWMMEKFEQVIRENVNIHCRINELNERIWKLENKTGRME
jgi:hypothetical protein